MNKVILIGRLTADPELRQTQSGIASCKFTVAVNRKFKNANGETESDFVSCQAWRQTAEFIARYFSKGKMIAIEGSLRTGKYQDKNHSDVTHYTTDVFVEGVEFCGDKGGTSTAAASQQPAQHTTPAQSMVNQAQIAGIGEYEEILSGDDDLPF